MKILMQHCLTGYVTVGQRRRGLDPPLLANQHITTDDAVVELSKEAVDETPATTYSIKIDIVQGSVGAWTNRTPLVWVGALLLTGLSIIGMMSIGFLLAPAALFLLGSAVFSQMAGPGTDIREAILADPPTAREVARKKLIGIGLVIVGLGLVYVGAFAHELFGSCARETFACALETTNWSAVGLTVHGLFAVSYGD